MSVAASQAGGIKWRGYDSAGSDTLTSFVSRSQRLICAICQRGMAFQKINLHYVVARAKAKRGRVHIVFQDISERFAESKQGPAAA